MPPLTESQQLDLLGDLVARSLKAGADAAEAVFVHGESINAGLRLGALEELQRAESSDIGLRVLIGKRQAFVSSSDRAPAALAELIERAVAMARVVPEDPFCGLAEPAQLATHFPEFDQLEAEQPEAAQLIEMALRAEDAGRAIPGVTNSEGATVHWGRGGIAMAASNGHTFARQGSGWSMSASMIAGGGNQGMERDDDYCTALHRSDLRSPEEVGAKAGERAVKRLGARKMPTCQVPVVLDPRVATGFLSHLIGAINGASVARGTSFLKDKLGKPVLPKGVRVMDDPHRMRGLRSRPCDGEGLPTRPMALVDDGVLASWLLDLRSARQLGMAPTGHATRGTSSPPSPSPSNIYMEAGAITPAEMIHDITDGFYITELFGQGVNGVTGDYSRGASGFWISGGEIAFPVNEVTVAGNLKDMFLNLTPASDLVFQFGTDCPTLRIDGVTVAGR
jgi:PmbA protein